MITGFNTNVRHGGRVFHVQTEDSGLKNPHVISHLYYGGTILSSQKRDYAQLLGQDADLTAAIRSLMEEQHRKMLEALQRGEFDAVIAERLGDPAAEDPTPHPAEAEVQAEPASAPPDPPSGDDPEFGDSVVSEKPLDEVILEYLVDKARTRAGDTRPGRGNRSRE
ncbi:MAG: hypothetical protein ACR2P8_02065 [Myxococcota bacterium]